MTAPSTRWSPAGKTRSPDYRAFDYLKPCGYRIRYQIVDFPGGEPSDISIVIAWAD